MKFLSCLLLQFVPVLSFAQQKSFPALIATEAAIYVPTATPIIGQKYRITPKIHSYYKDLSKNEIILIFQKDKEINIGAKGEIKVFDMNTGNIKWGTDINTFSTFITAQYIITSEKGNTHCYRRTDGKQMWSKTDANIKYVDEMKGILLTDYIRGLNIHTGKTLWQRYLPSKYNWEDIIKADDSSVIVSTGGIYKINLYTGKGWSTGNITTKDEFDVPGTFGIVAPAPKYPNAFVAEIENMPDVWRSTTSNLVINNGNIYVATNQRLLSLNSTTGELNWESPLLQKTGISILAITGDYLALAGTATVATNRETIKKYGDPHVRWFQLSDGKGFTQRGYPSRHTVRDVILEEKGAVLLLDSNLIRINSASPEPRVDLPHNDSVQYYSLLPHSSGNWYFVHDDKFEPHDEFKEEAVTMFTSDGVYTLKGLFDVYKNTFLPGESYDNGKYILFYKNGYNLVADNKKTLYDNVRGITVKTPETNKGFIHNDKLYVVDVNSITVIPLSQPK